MHFVPSISFTGQCAEAIEVYAKAFNAKVLNKTLFSAPVAKKNGYICAEGEENYIYYSEIRIGKQIISMADDSMNILDKNNPGHTRRLGLLMHFDNDEGLKVAFDLLADGGKIISAIESTTYCSAYAVVEDKYGITWQLMSGYGG